MPQKPYPAMEVLLPHRPPMILIDRLVDAQDKESTCEVTITPHTLFLESAGVPAYVGLEYMAQAIAAHGGYISYCADEPIALGFLLGTPRWQSWCRYFALGQTLWIHVTHVWGDNEFLRFHCTITDTATTTWLQRADLNVFKPKTFHAYFNEGADEEKGARDRR